MARAEACVVLAGLSTLLAACGARAPCDGLACAAACPRDATRDRSGRCACASADILVLGACVPATVADTYCGPAAKSSGDGCVFRACSEGERLDAVTGACLPKSTLPAAGAVTCSEGGAAVVSGGHTVCVAAEAACPRGTSRAGAVCPRPPSCPPGALPTEAGCRSVVSVGTRGDLPRVDMGAWTALVLGADGAQGKPDLCRPLTLWPDVFGLSQGTTATVSVRIAIVAPDQDITRLLARTQAQLTTPESTVPVSPTAEAVVDSAVATLIEPLRALGGEASTGAIEVEVRCRVNSFPGHRDRCN